MGERKGWIEKSIDEVLDLCYSKDKKILRYVLILTFVGFVLRLIAALHLDFFADDAIYALQSAGIIHSGILSTHSHPPLFFYLTDLCYKILGYTTLASRFIALIAGSLTIIVIFLITRKFFNERVALIAAFFATFSNFLVRMTFTEHSHLTFFLAFLGVYAGLLYLDKPTWKHLIPCGVFFGLSILTKYNGVFFLGAFLIFALYFVKTKKQAIFTKLHLKHFLALFIIVVLFATPFLVFNYLIYKEKGLVDFQFTRVFKPAKAQELFGNLAGQDKNIVQSIFVSGNYQNYKLLYKTDLLILVFALVGLGLLFKNREKRFLVFFLILLLVPFFLQSISSSLQKHFEFIPLLCVIPAGYALERLLSVSSKKGIKVTIMIVLIVLLLANLGTRYATPRSYLHPSASAEVKSYINNNVKDTDMIVVDPRIYTAISHWYAVPHHVLGLTYFTQFYNYHSQVPASAKQLTNVYFIECAIDDCGWGTIKDQPDLNKTVEDLFAQISSNGTLVKEVTTDFSEGNEFFDGTPVTSYKVYQMQFSLSPDLIKQTDSFNTFYFAPYLYSDMRNYLFNYSTRGLSELLDLIARKIIYISMFLSLLSFLVPFRYLLSAREDSVR